MPNCQTWALKGRKSFNKSIQAKANMNLLDFVNVYFSRHYYLFKQNFEAIEYFNPMGSWKVLKFGGFAKYGFQIQNVAKVKAMKGYKPLV